MNSVALAIQGPLHVNMIRNLEMNHDLFSEISIATWQPVTEIEEEILNDVYRAGAAHKNFKVHIAMLPPAPVGVYNPANLYYQALSTIRATEEITSYFTVKCRSDEYFHLGPFIAELFKDAAKPLFLNFIIREADYCNFHLSDHLYGATTVELVRSAVNLLAALCMEREEKWEHFVEAQRPPEVLLTVAFLVAKGETAENLVNLSREKAVKCLNRNFRIYDLRNLGPYEVKANHAGLGSINDIQTFCRIWNTRNTIDIRLFTSIDQLSPTSEYQRKFRSVARRLFHNRIVYTCNDFARHSLRILRDLR